MERKDTRTRAIESDCPLRGGLFVVKRRVIGQILCLGAPTLGGLSSAFYIALRATRFEIMALGDNGLHDAIVIWSIRDVVSGYLIAFPLLIAARRFGVRRVVAFVPISILAGYPVGHMLANPADYAWQPSDAEFAHGTYWNFLWSYMAISGITGLCFGIGTWMTASRPTEQ